MAAAVAAFIIIVIPTLLAFPFVARALAASNPQRGIPVTTVALLVGPVIFLLLFSLWGRVFPGYGLSLFAALITLGVISLGTGGDSTRCTKSNDRVFLLSFLVLFAVAYMLRIDWPALHWENSASRLGVERMFNLSLQQSFLHSETWPPNNLWLSGEPVQYHLLLRAAPGIASWFARVVFDAPLTGGVLYLIFDAFYLTLAPLAVAAWGFILMSTFVAQSGELPKTAERRCVIVSLLLGALTFVAPHGAAFIAGLGGLWTGTAVNFWDIQHEVVRGTVNFFPFGLLLSGESHSYAQAPFLQVCLWGSVIWQLCTPFSVPRALLTALLAAALAMAHPGSALLAGFGLTCAVLALLITSWRSLGRVGCLTTLSSLGFSGALAALLYLPSYLTLTPPETRWVWVTDALASPTVGFLSAQAAPLSVAVLFLLAGLRFNGFFGSVKSNLSPLVGLALVVALCILLARPAIAIGIVLSALVGLSSRRVARRPYYAAALACGVAMAWILPEVIVSDWAIDNRTDWVRFNTVMRFWLDGYYLVPLSVLAGCGAVVETRAGYRAVCLSLVTLAFISVISLYPLLQNRFDRTPESRSVDGFAFLRAEHSVDWWIVEFLSKLQGEVVIGEVCGTGTSPLTPYHYGMPGRLSAFSGRPSVCGWGRHTWMFQPVFTRGARSGESVWASFLAYEQALNVIYGSDNDVELRRAISVLRERGVTHLAFGGLEGQVFGNIDLRRLAERIHGTLVFHPIYGRGLIALPTLRSN